MPQDGQTSVDQKSNPSTNPITEDRACPISGRGNPNVAELAVCRQRPGIPKIIARSTGAHRLSYGRPPGISRSMPHRAGGAEMITPPKATQVGRDDIASSQRMIDILSQLSDFVSDPWCRAEIEAMIGERARLVMTTRGN